MITKKVYEFTGKYRFLSNFFIEPDGTHVEGEYQASKFDDPEICEEIRCMDPREAKAAGKGIWSSKESKLERMEKFVRRKFEDHPELMEQLVATGDVELEEGNWWGDTFWGKCRGVGENHLGKILMRIRDEQKAKALLL